ncbi:MAG: hypothetical protein HRT83_03305 [Hyphomicrobiaceae bacterium]|nr:hypothetical protein [Hyphomicrobiaceae bacterium]
MPMFTVLLLASLIAIAWSSDYVRSIVMSCLEKQDNQYLKKIAYLQSALTKSEFALEKERQLTSDLQNELFDAHDQLREMSFHIHNARSEKAAESSLSRGWSSARVEKSMSPSYLDILSLSNPTTNTSDPQFRTSLYAPSNNHKSRINGGVILPTLGKVEDIKVPSPRLSQHVAHPQFSEKTVVLKKIAVRKSPKDRKKLSEFRSRTVQGFKTIKSSGASMSLGHISRQKTYYLKRRQKINTRNQGFLFNSLARQGVFGEGYYTQ